MEIKEKRKKENEEKKFNKKEKLRKKIKKMKQLLDLQIIRSRFHSICIRSQNLRKKFMSSHQANVTDLIKQLDLGLSK